MQPTDEQRSAMDGVGIALERHAEAVLVGAAGTGKTTVVQWLIEELLSSGWGVQLATPTGRAAVRLREVTGHAAATLHSLLYARVDEDDGDLVFGDARAPCDPGEVLIVDEASMVGSSLYADIMRHLPEDSRVLWVGDHEQLEPVKDTWGPDLQTPTAILRTVHRQAQGNPVIAYATAIREQRSGTWRSTYDNRDERLQIRRGAVDQARDWLVDRLQAHDDATAITFTHRTREAVNAYTRQALGFRAPLEPGDRLCNKMNSHALRMYNGEVYTVAQVRPAQRLGRPAWEVHLREHSAPVYVLQEHLNDRSQAAWHLRRSMSRQQWDDSRIMYAWHGFCLTVHASQGSQWDHVCFVADSAVAALGRRDRDFARRLCYTAVTRTADRLLVLRV